MPVATAEVDVRAKLDNFDRDLQSARQKLDNFDSSSKRTTETARAFQAQHEKSSKTVELFKSGVDKASDGLHAFEDANKKVVTALSGFVDAASNTVVGLTGIQVANDNVVQSSNRLAANQQKSAAASDQQRKAMDETGNSSLKTVLKLVELVSMLQLVTGIALRASPAFQGFASKLGTIATEGVSVADVTKKMGEATAAAVPQAVKAGEALKGMGTAAAAAAAGWVSAVRAGKGVEATAAAMGAAKEKATELAGAVGITGKRIEDLNKLGQLFAILGLAQHFTGASVAAYTLSGSVRQVVHQDVKAGLGAIAGNVGLIGTAAKTAYPAVQPLASALGTLALRLGVPAVIALGTWKALVALFELGEKKVTALTDKLKTAAEIGISQDFFERMQVSGKKFKVTADDVTASLKQFNQVTLPQLGGSVFDRTLIELRQAGNFAQNTGVQVYRTAVTTEQRWRGMAQIIQEAVAKGEKLAALKLAETFLPPAVVERARTVNGFLIEWLNKADALNQTDLINDRDIQKAAELKTRFEAASHTIKEFVKVVLPDFTSWGLALYEIWVKIVEKVAGGIEAITKFAEKTAKIVRDAAASSQQEANRQRAMGLGNQPLAPESLEMMKYGVPPITPPGGIGGLGSLTVGPTQIDVDTMVRQAKALAGATRELRSDFEGARESSNRYDERLSALQASLNKTAKRIQEMDSEFDSGLNVIRLTIQEYRNLIAVQEEFGRVSVVAKGGITAESGARERTHAEGVKMLTAAMHQYGAVAKATQAIENQFGDTSKSLDAMWQRTTERLTRSIALEKARAAAVGQGVAAEARLRVETMLFEMAQMEAANKDQVYIDKRKMSEQEVADLREKARKAGKGVVEISEAQIATEKRLGDAAAISAVEFEMKTQQLRNSIQAQTLSLGLSKDEAAVAHELARLYPNVAEGVRSLLAQERLRLQTRERLRDLQKETHALEMGLAADEMAIFSALKDHYRTVEDALGSREAKQMRLNNQIKLQRSLEFDYYKVAYGLTEQQIQIVDALKNKYGETAEGIRRALSSPEAGLIRVTQALTLARDQLTGFGTDFYTNVVESLRAGDKAAEAFRKGFQASMRRLVDDVIQMAIKNVLTNLLGMLFTNFVTSTAGAAGGFATAVIGAGGTAATELTAAGGMVSGSMIAGATEAGFILEGAGGMVSGSMIAGATEAAFILEGAKVATLGLQQGGIIGPFGRPMLTAQQGIVVPTPPSGMGTGVPILAHPGEEVLRRDDPRNALNGGRGGGASSAPTIHINFTANGRMTSSDIREHANTIAKQVAQVFDRNPSMRPSY